MFAYLRRWLSPPQFLGDEIKTRHVNLIQLVLLIAIGTNLAVIIGDLLGDNIPLPTIGIGMTLLAGCLGAYFIMRRGYIRAAAVSIIIIGMISVTFAAASLGTIRTPTTAMYLIGVIMAGLLFERRGLIATILFSSLGVAGLIVAENAGWLPRPSYIVTVTQWLMYTVEFGAVGVLIRLAGQSFQRALQRADRELAMRQQAEAALRASEQHYKTLIDNQGEGLGYVDPAEVFTFCNPSAERVFGVPAGQLVGRNLREFMTPEQFSEIQRQTALRQQNQKSIYEIEIRRLNDGQLRQLMVTAVPQLNEQGELLGSFGVFRDITERKHAEAALRELNATLEQRVAERTAQLTATNETLERQIIERTHAEAALRESEERFRQLAENIREVFWLTNRDASQFLYVSPAYEDIYGLKTTDLLAQPAAFLSVVTDPADRARILDALRRNTAGQSAFVEYHITRADGSTSWIWNRSFPVLNAAGEVERIAGIAEDVNEFKRVEDELRRALIKEQELSDLKSQFISMASHDFRTPLTSILTSADLLEHYTARLSEEKKMVYVRRIQTSVRHMTQLLEDVLIIGRADAGKLEFAPGPIDLIAFSHALLDEVRPTATPQHTLKFDHNGDFADTWLDEKLLRQIMINLLSNAIKYSPAGGPIRLSLQREQAHIIIVITDHGLGIPPDAQLHLFESFFRAKNTGNISGNGLGLAIVQRAVDAHGGHIQVSSTLGAGSTFTVTLPWQPVTAE
ncbi:MAG: PAS domain S-box protein [Thermoflexales bacterium]|nr:PAS domain S-box protein [Thermoflexales bacterium]